MTTQAPSRLSPSILCAIQHRAHRPGPQAVGFVRRCLRPDYVDQAPNEYMHAVDGTVNLEHDNGAPVIEINTTEDRLFLAALRTEAKTNGVYRAKSFDGLALCGMRILMQKWWPHVTPAALLLHYTRLADIARQVSSDTRAHGTRSSNCVGRIEMSKASHICSVDVLVSSDATLITPYEAFLVGGPRDLGAYEDYPLSLVDTRTFKMKIALNVNGGAVVMGAFAQPATTWRSRIGF